VIEARAIVQSACIGEPHVKPTDGLTAQDIDIISRCMKAAVDGSFFPDWEFPILFGLEREAVRTLQAEWPAKTLADERMQAAVANSLVMLSMYPHNSDDELLRYVPEGRPGMHAVLAKIPPHTGVHGIEGLFSKMR
jgi:hypothetical protein